MESGEYDPPRLRRILTSLAPGGVGLLFVYTPYLILAPSLPPAIPRSDFIGPNIPATTPAGLLEFEFATVILLTILFLLVTAVTLDEEFIVWNVGRRTYRLNPVLGLEAAFVSVGLPVMTSVTLAGAAGVLPPGFPVGSMSLLSDWPRSSSPGRSCSLPVPWATSVNPHSIRPPRGP